MKRFLSVIICFVYILLFGCSDQEKQSAPDPIFQRLSAEETGITFRNDLEFDRKFNIYTYRNFYNGGGVAIGDINGDSLPDIYFTSNLGKNQLYLNLGDFRFKDITDAAGVGGNRRWSTGVTMADVNGDGWLDIYVCNSGDIKNDNKQNELFINNGDLTFTESAQSYGLADLGYSTHAAFFDFDHDGDLDMYLLNNSFQPIGSFNLMQDIRAERDEAGGDKLFRNDGDHFTDVSRAAGIYGSVIGFGLGVTVGDVNNDGWEDIYVSNDFFERDYLYMNNGDGTFTEKLTKNFSSISAASMGADMADINNDGWLDLFVTDMLPEQDARFKQITTFENWDKLQYNHKHGYHYQFNRNMLHLNAGDGKFIEVGRLANVEATDWSWGALFFDMDNDGHKDIFVANGIYQDITDLDYLSFIVNENTVKKIISESGVDYEALISPIPINPVSNYAFRNKGTLQFVNVAKEWGLGEPVHSNGAAYGDLNNDGTLDLVLNNVNQVAFIYKNNAGLKNGNHFLKIALDGVGMNRFGIGARITIWAGSDVYSFDQMPTRGFQSTVEPVILAGVGKHTMLDSLRIVWSGGKHQLLKRLKTSETITLRQRDAVDVKLIKKENITPIMREATAQSIGSVRHIENKFIDFDRDRLTYHMLSTQGPALATGDVNGDGLDDFYLGGAKGYPGQLFLQTKDGKFRPQSNAPFVEDARHEDVDAALFDIDNDGDLDLFVASGGNEFSLNAGELLDRIYVNNGKGIFTRSEQPGMRMRMISSVVRPADFDGDGDIDIFLGSRAIPFSYGMAPSSYLLENDGTGKFSDVSERWSDQFSSLGMVTDAAWSDIDADGDMDLLVVGEWMPLEIFENQGDKLVRGIGEKSAPFGNGWWNCIVGADLDGDGDDDFILGNHGLNSRFKGNPEHPVYLYVNDFDSNGSIEHLYARSIGTDIYPYTLRHDLVAQIPELKKKYLKYSHYNDQRVNDIFSDNLLKQSLRLEATEMRSGVIWNDKGTFTFQPLPIEAQVAPVFAFFPKDLDGDGIMDIICGGNFFESKPEAGRYDANQGVILKGLGNRSFRALNARETGYQERGAVREMKSLNWKGTPLLIIAPNNDSLRTFTYAHP